MEPGPAAAEDCGRAARPRAVGCIKDENRGQVGRKSNLSGRYPDSETLYECNLDDCFSKHQVVTFVAKRDATQWRPLRPDKFKFLPSKAEKHANRVGSVQGHSAPECARPCAPQHIRFRGRANKGGLEPTHGAGACRMGLSRKIGDTVTFESLCGRTSPHALHMLAGRIRRTVLPCRGGGLFQCVHVTLPIVQPGFCSTTMTTTSSHSSTPATRTSCGSVRRRDSSYTRRRRC